MPRGDHNLPVLVPNRGEDAPGIPSVKRYSPIPEVKTPQQWQMATQVHEAERAGPHLDLRLVDPRGLAHSWAIPRAALPGPGEKFLAVPQPTHTEEYAARKGSFTLGEGYGKGKVTGSGLQPVELLSSKPGLLRFNCYRGRETDEFAIVKTTKGHLLANVTPTRESGVRGPGGHDIPSAKPKYRDVKETSVSFDDPNEIHQAKIDGAHVTIHFPSSGGQVRVFSHRPTERSTGVIEHTYRIPRFHELKAPASLAGTVVRGELWAADPEGRALPAERIGGLLNASVPKSRELQQRHGELRGAIFDVVRYRGKEMEGAPYREKLKVLKDVAGHQSFFRLPPTAETPEEKRKLFADIQAGKLDETKEGIVQWHLDQPGPRRTKFRPDVDAEVVGIFPGKGKHTGRAGGLLVKLPESSAVTRVGTGFSDRLRGDLANNPERYIGRVAKVETQQVFQSGKLRAPSFKEWHLEKGKQAEATMRRSFLDELELMGAAYRRSLGVL